MDPKKTKESSSKSVKIRIGNEVIDLEVSNPAEQTEKDFMDDDYDNLWKTATETPKNSSPIDETSNNIISIETPEVEVSGKINEVSEEDPPKEEYIVDFPDEDTITEEDFMEDDFDSLWDRAVKEEKSKDD